MAKSNAVWGIDIGQCALKALRCRPHEKDDHRIVVEAFDYIEYPKILTQPEANRDELIKEALEQFVSRNDVSGDEVAISVSGQSGLARFIKLPPVERKKIPDIVKYEARQQIPFALEDVVWDYQPLVGSEDEGYALETEVGLFAMKRDQVAKALKPLEEAAIDVDIIQLAPLAIYNFISFDRLKVEGPYDPANPPQSTVVISLGTDTTDLVITNGYRVWQRSIPIGGNHFTKALTKELKLTFAKAEHLKRNAMKAENPKAVFQAMRPVFSDLVAEIQRSIGFFTSNNRNAKLGEMVALGNPMKLPGLQRFLSQNLDQEIKLVDSFNSLVGGSNTASPQFKENQLTFGVSYGLCLQALDKAQLKTNLLPEEIVTTRLVRAKKPWAVIAVALLLLGMTINYLSHYSAWKTAALGASNPAMDRAIQAAKNVQDENTKFTSENTTLTASFDTITTTGENLQSNVDGRLLWLEVLKAIDAALPKDSRPVDQRKETAADVMLRPELHITSVDCEYFPALAPWYSGVERFYDSAVAYRKAKEAGQKPPAAQPTPAPGDAAAAGTTPPAEDATATPTTSAAEAGTTTAAEAAAPPAEAPATSEPPAVDPNAAATATGEALADGSAPAADDWRAKPGWVIQLDGYHFHNGDPDNEGAQFIIDTFFKDLEEGKVSLPDGPDGKPIEVPIAELGIHHPVLITQYKIWDATYLPQAVDDQAAAGGVLGMGARPSYSRDEEGGGQLPGEQAPEMWKLRRYDFRIQFAWQPQPRGKRLEKMAGQKTESTRTAATEPASTDGNR